MNEKSVLIIEDDKFFRDLLTNKLKEAGFNPLPAQDGGEAFNLLKAVKPDLIVLDLVLPGLSGMEILEALRKEEKTEGVPVIVLSNLSEPEEMDKAKALGVVDFLVKVNFTPEEIVERIKKALFF